MISLFGSCCTIVVPLVKRRYFSKEFRPLVLLLVSDFLATLTLFIMAVIQLLPIRQFDSASIICYPGVTLAVVFYSISFLMVMIYAYEAKQSIQGWRETAIRTNQESKCTQKEFMCLIYILAWSVPLFMYIVYIVYTSLMHIIIDSTDNTDQSDQAFVTHYGQSYSESSNTSSISNTSYIYYCSSCIMLIHRNYDCCYGFERTFTAGQVEKIMFFIYTLIALNCCMFLYYKVTHWWKKKTNETNMLLSAERDSFACKNIRSVCKTICFIQIVFIICWSPAFILSIISFTSVNPSDIYGLYVLQALTMSLQGFLNSLAYGWLRRNFREVATGERIRLLENLRQCAFYDESLTCANQ